MENRVRQKWFLPNPKSKAKTGSFHDQAGQEKKDTVTVGKNKTCELPVNTVTDDNIMGQSHHDKVFSSHHGLH